MLTRMHLSVICAALMYWDEEMSPHDPELFAFYFPEPIGTGEWITPAVRFLRGTLPLCQVRYAPYSPSGTGLAGSWFDSLEAAQSAGFETSAQLATVLIFPTKV